MWTDHNKFFGWVHNFRFSSSSLFFGNPNKRPPYPPIMRDPQIRHALHNWNIADTGMFLTAAVIGVLLAKRTSNLTYGIAIGSERPVYYLFLNVYMSIAAYLGLQNSYYRLTGLTANGLKWEEEPEPELKKYDFSSDFVEKTFWKYIFEDEMRK